MAAGTTILADIVSRVSGRPWIDVARKDLFEPMGIVQWEWVTDLRDRPAPFAGLRMRPRDMAKLGRLMLNHGRWNGQQIVSAEWVDESLKPRLSVWASGSPGNQPDELRYGYQWWAGTGGLARPPHAVERRLRQRRPAHLHRAGVGPDGW